MIRILRKSPATSLTAAAALLAVGLVGSARAAPVVVFQADVNGNSGVANVGPVHSGWTAFTGTESGNPANWTHTQTIGGISIALQTNSITSGNTGYRNRSLPTAGPLSDVYQALIFAANNIDIKMSNLTIGQQYQFNVYCWDSGGGNTGDRHWNYSLAGNRTGGVDAGWVNQPASATFTPAANTGITSATKGIAMLSTTFTATGTSVNFFTVSGGVHAINGFELYTVTPVSTPPDAGISTVAVSPVTLPANGTTATVSVILKDNTSTPVAGKTVTLASSRGASDTISAASGTSDGSGLVTFTVSSATPGTSVFTATDTSDSVILTQTASVIFTGPPDAVASTVAAALSSVPANGSTTSTITVTLKDVNSNPIAGKTVTLASDRSASDTISAASGVSNASGVVTFTVKSATVGTANFSATDSTDGITVTAPASVNFTAIPPADTLLSTLSASPTTQVANGTSTATITVTLLDGTGNPVSGKTVTLASDRGATDTISAASGASTLAGVVTFTVKSSTAGAPVFTATDTTDSVVATATTSVAFTWPPLVANAGGDKSVAAGFPATLGGTPAASGGSGSYTYSWDPSSDLSNASAANPVASPSVTTVYTLTVTDTVTTLTATSPATVTFTVPNANLASVDFIQSGGTPCLGDTTLTGTTMKNAIGNLFTGQLGPWNSVNIGTYNNNSASSGFLHNGGGATTTVKLALGLATGLDSTTAGGWRCNPNEGATGGSNQLRFEEAYLYNGVITGDHYAWALTGLLPNSPYRLTFFGDIGNATGASHTANSVAATRDSEGDWNWTSVTSDANGKIIGAFTAPNPTLGLYGLQVEGTLPLPLTANAGTPKNVSPASPATLGGTPVATGGSGNYSYSWSPATDLDNALAANPLASPSATTTYVVTVTDTTTNATASASVLVTFVPGSAYDTWAALHAGGQSASEDFNHDGVPNGIAFFMGMDGLATNPGIVNGKVTWPHVGSVSAYEVQVSNDLINWVAADPASVDSVTDPAQVVFTLPTGASKQFCRITVTP